MKKIAKFLLKIIIILLILAGVLGASIYGGKQLFKSWIREDNLVKMTENEKEQEQKTETAESKEENKIVKRIKISAVGDCTIGWDTKHDEKNRFDDYLAKNDDNYGYYLEKVKDIFSDDDLTIANFEGTFTEETEKVEKEYNFSAPDAYKEVLTKGNIDIVSFANNHTHDYGEKGYNDTIKTFNSIEMPYYGYDKYLIKEVNGIKIGFFGLVDIDCKNYEEIDKALENLKKENCDLIIASMHWGIEGDYKQNVSQVRMGHYLIDNGVDLVLGSHPHRYQGIEKYNGRFIVYSLGNFCFGGNNNPKDKDTLIFQKTFTFEDGKLVLDDNINILPASISSERNTNNYQPTVLEENRGRNVLNKILRFSKGFIYIANNLGGIILKKLLLIDGNSIMNRAFYGIMGSKMLMTKDGKYTNAVYGFLAIMFKILDDLNPDYMAVSFDLKAPTARHKMYSGYKANRHGMPNELAEQMPMIKEVLKAMNIDIVEKEGYEGDDILGTLAKYGEKEGLEVVILSGDRDTFQLATDKVTIRIPRTKAGKTETEDYDRKKVKDEYGIEPRSLIEVKGLQGDSSDNIPGVPGIGPKTAISLIQKYGTIENLYKAIDDGKDDLKGKQKEAIVANRDMAYLSKTLGTIDVNVPLEDTLENLKVEEWDKKKVLEIFENLNFKRYIQKFNLEDEGIFSEDTKNVENEKELFTINEKMGITDVQNMINNTKKCAYYFGTEKDENQEKILKLKVRSISIFDEEKSEVYYIKNPDIQFLKNVFENEEIEKIGFEMNYTYILLKEMGITPKNLKFDVSVAAYILNPTDGKYPIDKLLEDYLDLNVEKYLKTCGIEDQTKQMTLFDSLPPENEKDLDMYKNSFYVYGIYKLSKILKEKLKEKDELKLFETIDMPTIEVLGDMQWNGMYVEKDELQKFGENLQDGINFLTQEIYNLAGEEFNIKSPKQLGELLFEKLKLPVIKKTKSGYSTDVDVLEKLRGEHPIIEKLLDYRQLTKLNSTYVEGLKPYINPKTKRIHSFFHQTITATGRISSTEPNLQNIPTRIEFGKQLRKVFKPAGGKVYIDADYSQIELRVLAHLSGDEHMIAAFKNGEDIHKQAASKVFGIPQDEVTKEQRSSAKAVNFGIVYGISDFGLGQQLGISRKQAKIYIEQYLEQYSGVRKFMQEAISQAKEKGYSETLYNRKREIKELSSNNYMVRQFGERAAMNTPVQGTAADIMKIAMIKVYNELKNKNLQAKIVLQVHDEMMLEVPIEEKEEVKILLKNAMENAAFLKVPLIAEVSEADNWYNCK